MNWSSQPSPDGSGLFCIVRHAVGVDTIECDGFETRRRADQIASTMNQNYARDEARRAAQPLDRADRPIPKGFYTDRDAA